MLDHRFFLAFIPIFVAIDPIGLLPIFISLTQDLEKQSKRQIIGESVLTALGLAVGFIFLGRAIFNLLGITLSDFMVAGGTVLFCLALTDILTAGKPRFVTGQSIGAVPLGTPLMVGPAVLTTSFIMIDQYGLSATLFSIAANILLVALVFLFSGKLIKLLGEGGSRALSKIMALLLAAIAVMLIRKGIFEMIATH